MKYGLHVGNGGAVTDPAVLRDVAQMAEELGDESILIGDHVLPPRKIHSPFPLPVQIHNCISMKSKPGRTVLSCSDLWQRLPLAYDSGRVWSFCFIGTQQSWRK